MSFVLTCPILIIRSPYGDRSSRSTRSTPYRINNIVSITHCQNLLTIYFSLKLECEKLVSEKTEIQRHYVMYYEMSYGLNIEMHKQSEIVKRLNSIIAQILPFLSQEVRE